MNRNPFFFMKWKDHHHKKRKSKRCVFLCKHYTVIHELYYLTLSFLAPHLVSVLGTDFFFTIFHITDLLLLLLLQPVQLLLLDRDHKFDYQDDTVYRKSGDTT